MGLVIPLTSVEEMDLDLKENRFNESCVNVVGAERFVGVMM
jgi:hypothetical protein